MKHKSKLMKGSVLIIGAILLSMTAIAQQYERGNKQNCLQNRGCENVLPDLTEDQKEQIEALRTAHMKEMLAYKADIKILHAELNKLEISDNPDQKTLNAKIEEIGMLKIDMAKERSKHRIAVRSLLTDEQRVIFDSHKGRCGKQANAVGHKKRGA